MKQIKLAFKEVLLLWFILFDKKSPGSGVNNKIKQNEKLAEDLHKPIIIIIFFKVYFSFKDSIWGTDLANMQLISKYNKEIRFLLYVTDIFSKYAWVISLKD